MKKNYLPATFFINTLLLLTSITGFSQTLQWGKRGGSSDEIPGGLVMRHEQVVSMAADHQGNVFALSPVGISSLNVDGVEKENYSAYDGGGGPGLDYMISSFDCDGELRWAKVIGGPDSDYFRTIKIDGAGSVYTAGDMWNLQTTFAQDIHFDEDLVIPYGDGSVNRQSLYLVKYSNDGELEWVRTPQPADIDFVESITKNRSLGNEVDKEGNSYWLCSIMQGSYCNGSYINTAEGSTLHIFKYDSAGEFVSAHPMDIQIQGYPMYTFKMVRNNDTGIVYIAGHRYSTEESDKVIIDGQLLQGTMYIAAFDDEGSFLWKKENIETVQGPWLNDLTLDPQGNVYITGGTWNNDGFGNQVFASPTPYIFPFVTKFSAGGNVLWASHAITEAGIDAKAIIVNGNEVLVTGGGIGIEWGNFEVPMVMNAGYDIYMARLNRETGAALGLTSVVSGNPSWDYGSALASANGNYYVGAEFSTNITVGGETLYNTGSQSDFAVMKYGTESCCVFPLPEFSFQREGGEFSFDYTGEGFTTIAWDFGDDTGTSTIEDPDHSYTEDGDYVVCVTVTNDCGSQQYCRQVTAAGTAGTSDRALEQLKAYPNPVNNLLTISSNSELSYVLYSVPGAKIQDGSLFTGQQQIDMRSLPSGFYILTLKNGQGEQKTIKVVKE